MRTLCGGGAGAEEDVEAPVGVVVAEGVEAGLVFGGGVEGDLTSYTQLCLKDDLHVGRDLRLSACAAPARGRRGRGRRGLM